MLGEKYSNAMEVWESLSNGCSHDELMFGDGDTYIFCGHCGRSWTMDERWKNKVGKAVSLTGKKRVNNGIS